MLAAGFRATTDASVVADAEVVVICVPTPLSEEGGPDLSAVRGAAESIAPYLAANALVAGVDDLPGHHRGVPAADPGGRLRRRVGIDLSLAFSPERIDPGNPTFGIANTEGGRRRDAGLHEQARAFYAQFVAEVVPARGTREAEMAKLLENTYRHVNIALVNEMVQFCHELDIDLWNVIELARTKPFGFQAFYPGPGVGGHCIPIDPNYLSHRVEQQLGHPFRFVELAQEINASMPAYVAQRAQNLLNDNRQAINGSVVLLLGVTYKANIADERESPATPLAERLLRLGAEVVYHDPYVASWTAGPGPGGHRPDGRCRRRGPGHPGPAAPGVRRGGL